MEVNSERLEAEFVRSKKPVGNWLSFLNVVLDNYRDKTNCIYGFIVYDWLSEKGYLKGFSFMNPGSTNEARSLEMDRLLVTKKLTIDQIQTYINENNGKH